MRCNRVGERVFDPDGVADTSAAFDRCRLNERPRWRSNVSNDAHSATFAWAAGVDGPELGCATVSIPFRGNVLDRDPPLRLQVARSVDLARGDTRIRSLPGRCSEDGESRFIIWLNFFRRVPRSPPCDLCGDVGGVVTTTTGSGFDVLEDPAAEQ